MKLATAAIALLFPTLGLSQITFTNPLKTSEGGDPVIVYQDGYYYLMATNFVDLRMTRATTLEGLKTGETRVVWAPDDVSRSVNVWAPELHFLEGAWYIYFAAGPGGTDQQRALALKGGNDPWGEFRFDRQMRDDWSIDGTHVRVNEQDYFVYSGLTTEGVQSLFIAPLLTPSTTGEAKVLSIPTEDWEITGFPVNEGPFALYHKDKVMLSFSASFCGTTSYQLGLLTYTGGDPMDSTNWSKTGPVFSQDPENTIYGPGHNSFFKSPSGNQTWNVYHSTTNVEGNCHNERVVNAQPIVFDSDGTPVFGSPVGSQVEVDEPDVAL